jgi:IclR family transcriptional regulator, KDG regulon repressor
MDDQKLTVRAVERALDVVLCFTDSAELTLTEIAAKVDLHKSTVHRLLASLEGRGFVIRHKDTDKYRLGFRIWELAANMEYGDDPATILLPEMERLRDQVDETISLYVRDGIERIRIQAVQSNQAIRRVAPIGARLPLSVGASSKVLIAFADAAEQRELLDALSWAAGERVVFERQLGEIRRLGYATSIEEREPGAAAVSAPIFSRSRKLVAALAVSGPANRLTLENMKERAALIMEAAARMGKMVR